MVASEATHAILVPKRSERRSHGFRISRFLWVGFHFDVVERADLRAFAAAVAVAIGVEGLMRHEKGVEEPSEYDAFGPWKASWDGFKPSLPGVSDKSGHVVESCLGLPQFAVLLEFVVHIEARQRDVCFWHDDREATRHLPSFSFGSPLEIMIHTSGVVATSCDEIDITDILHLHPPYELEDELGHSPCIDREDETKFLIGSQFIVCLPLQFIRDEA